MKSLKNFPEDFQPLVIVTGDRREVPGKSKGDMLAYPVSMTDFMYITQLNLKNSLILSDKQFVNEKETILKERFGSTNILVIGSPAVNLLARRINDQSIFRFSITEETREELEEQNEFMNRFTEDEDDFLIYHQCLEGIVDVNSIIARFVGLEPNIEDLMEKAKKMLPEFIKTRICKDLKTNPRPIRYLLHKLDRPGIFDSFAKLSRGASISAFKDYGLISVMDNPFSKNDKYSIVFVAGVHGPGTARGVELLKNKNAFNDHPYGGVFEARIDQFVTYFERFQNSKVRWETRPYSEKDYDPESFSITKNVKIFLSGPAKQDDVQQKNFNIELKNVLIEICKSKNLNLEIEGPYTLPLGGHHDFWEAILDYEKNCHLIIHDVTHCARGVMIEIGFSFGSKKQHFLIWNLQKAQIKSYKEMKIPSLLPVSQIDQIDLSDKTTSRITLQKKVIEKALDNIRNFDCSECVELKKGEKGKKVAYVFTIEKELKNYLYKELAERDVHRIDEEESEQDLRICKICQVMRVADFALIEISNSDLNSFIILGIAKAIGLKTKPFSLDRYKSQEFPWAEDIMSYQIDTIPNILNIPLAKFLRYKK